MPSFRRTPTVVNNFRVITRDYSREGEFQFGPLPSSTKRDIIHIFELLDRDRRTWEHSPPLIAASSTTPNPTAKPTSTLHPLCAVGPCSLVEATTSARSARPAQTGLRASDAQHSVAYGAAVPTVSCVQGSCKAYQSPFR